MIPHGDIVCVIHPNQHIVQIGWRILTPHENKDDNYNDGDDDDDDDHDHDHDHDHDDCKCGATSGLGRTCFRRLRFDLLLFPFIKAGNLASCLVLMPYLT